MSYEVGFVLLFLIFRLFVDRVSFYSFRICIVLFFYVLWALLAEINVHSFIHSFIGKIKQVMMMHL